MRPVAHPSRRGQLAAPQDEEFELCFSAPTASRSRRRTRSKNGWTARRFIGDDNPRRRKDTVQLRLWFAGTVLTAANCEESLASALLEAAFSQLFEGAATKQLPWLRFDEDHEVGRREFDQAIQILLDQLRLRAPEQLYRCPSTGTLWPRTIFGWAPLRGCLGQLQKITHAEADDDRRWGRARRELREFPIFAMGLWAEEHSAQLSHRKTSAGRSCLKMVRGTYCPPRPRWNLASISAD